MMVLLEQPKHIADVICIKVYITLINFIVVQDERIYQDVSTMGLHQLEDTQVEMPWHTVSSCAMIKLINVSKFWCSNESIFS